MVRVAESEHRQIVRVSVAIRGAVQGVGFRPFVFNLASRLCLRGWVLNSSEGVFIEAEGDTAVLHEFLALLKSDKPRLAFIQSFESAFLDPVGYENFEIRKSDRSASPTALVLPDIATCPDCLRELFDPSDRRHRYPFINCTLCGPRFTIIEGLPYDRPLTTMKMFTMCPACALEYGSPDNRRFHAQPNACPACGPQMALWDVQGNVAAANDEAMREACEAIRQGDIVAVKGIGGFHLFADARNNAAVERLRRAKRREEKPFAVMVPSIEQAGALCELSMTEKNLLLSPESPIVLVIRKNHHDLLSAKVAPGNPFLGVMLPSNPIHHLIAHELGFPVIATSGNLSEEPICTDEQEALVRLRGIADFFLVHNRPIVRHADDSIARSISGREMLLRRARGYAPLPVHTVPHSGKEIIALGGHLKNTVAFTVKQNTFVSQHIGDLSTPESLNAFQSVINGFSTLFKPEFSIAACDLHPDYLSTKHAKTLGIPLVQVQHHVAHVAACAAENALIPPFLGVAWDGTGYGTDGTIWGGEFFHTTGTEWSRFATLRRFLLPGGEAAVREPRRTALALLMELPRHGTEARIPTIPAFSKQELQLLRQAIRKKVNAPATSSMGRLFDAIASLLGICQISRYEGQAAMELEFAAMTHETEKRYQFFSAHPANGSEPIVLDWEPLLSGVVEDHLTGLSAGLIARKFHNTLTETIVQMAAICGEPKVLLSGGCFQNSLLTVKTIERLREEGFTPYWHQRIPPNDGGISVGQVFAAAHGWTEKKGTNDEIH